MFQAKKVRWWGLFLFSSKIWVHFIRRGISIGLLLVAEAGLALGPLGRFQNEMKKELRPGACEGSCYRYEKSPIVIGLLSCGGRTRTCDLQVMSLASYQLLHSAMLTIRKIPLKRSFPFLRVQRYCFFRKRPNKWSKFCIYASLITILQVVKEAHSSL